MLRSALMIRPEPSLHEPVLVPVDDARVSAEIERVRASGILGPPGRQSDLFDFLVAHAMDERPPKEIEIGCAVFWKGQKQPENDSTARVYVHRLRRRLEEFYQRREPRALVQLAIPKGEYRIVGYLFPEAPAAAIAEPQIAADARPAAPARKRPLLLWLAAAAVFLLAANVIALLATARPKSPDDALRATPFWSGLVKSSRPLVVVMGDYYMFGEYENQTTLRRVVHDPMITSKSDLVAQYLSNPSKADHYGDLALQYLPSSSASVLADLAPIIGSGKQTQIVLASELTPDRLKNDDIIYVGLLSGMGVLYDRVFSRSRFEPSDTAEGLTDHKTGKSYVSEALLASPGDTMYRDYGFVSAFEGPSGNRVVIIAGTHDTGLMGASETLTTPSALARLNGQAGAAVFEGLLEVKGQKHVNLKAEPVAVQPIDSNVVWAPAN
jgi:hypothetical protein